MQQNKLAIIIPARLSSTRLPNKVLADLCGKKMIERVIANASDANIGDVILAYADNKIIDSISINPDYAIKTDPNIANGSMRVYDAYQQLKANYRKNYQYIINLQGDLPILDPNLLIKIADSLYKKSDADNYDIVTPVCEIIQEEEIRNPNVVKVALSEQNMNALYFSRAVIPYNANVYYKHIGIYGFDAVSLQKFMHLPSSDLERCEKLEQLRALENNMKIRCIKSDSCPISVDTEADLDVARNLLGDNKD